MKVPVTDFKVTMSEKEIAWMYSYFTTHTVSGHPLLFPSKPNCSECGKPNCHQVVADGDGWEIILSENGREFWAAFDPSGELLDFQWLDSLGREGRVLLELPFLSEEFASLTPYARGDKLMLLCRHCARPEVAS
jgi:hypothetical protein